MMKLLKVSAIFFAVLALLTTACTTYHANHNSKGHSPNVYSNIKAKVSVGSDVEGRSSRTTILGLIHLGDSEYADGVNYGATQSAQNPGLFGSIVGGGDPAASVKAAAALKAVRGGNCDFIVDPKYVVNIQDFIIFKKVDVTVTGKAGNVTGYSPQ